MTKPRATWVLWATDKDGKYYPFLKISPMANSKFTASAKELAKALVERGTEDGEPIRILPLGRVPR